MNQLYTAKWLFVNYGVDGLILNMVCISSCAGDTLLYVFFVVSFVVIYGLVLSNVYNSTFIQLHCLPLDTQDIIYCYCVDFMKTHQ